VKGQLQTPCDDKLAIMPKHLSQNRSPRRKAAATVAEGQLRTPHGGRLVDLMAIPVDL